MANGLKQGREDLIAVHVGGDLIAFGKGRAQRSFERLSKGRVTERRRVFPARALVTLPKNRQRAQHRPRTPADTGESEEPRDGNISRRPRHRYSFAYFTEFGSWPLLVIFMLEFQSGHRV